MFTGIIETIGTVARLERQGSNMNLYIDSLITNELKIDQSVAHNGVCLTIVAINGYQYKVTAVDETLSKTNLGKLAQGGKVNLERAIKAGDRIDGHFVQGHVDTTGICIEQQVLDGSWLYRFQFPPQFGQLIIEKGSICINGISLTAFNVGKDQFTVTIIPFTYVQTNFCDLAVGNEVNIEFDVFGKYILRSLELKK